MDERQAIFAAILAEPDEDLPRLIYADWLDEHDMPVRAEFIRVQVALAREPEYTPRFYELRFREREIIRTCYYPWRANLPHLDGITWGDYHRGFIGSIALSRWQDFEPFADQIWDTEPVTLLEVPRQSLPAMLESPQLDRVCGLKMEGLTYNETSQLLAQPLGRVSKLVLNHCEFSGTSGPFFCSENLAHLKHLTIQRPDNVRFVEPDYGDIENRIQPIMGTQRLKTASIMGRFGRDMSVEWMFQLPQLSELEQLTLNNFLLTDHNIAGLMNAPMTMTLRGLSLVTCNLSLPQIKMLVNAEKFPRLELLDLRNNPLNDRARKLLRRRFDDRVWVE